MSPLDAFCLGVAVGALFVGCCVMAAWRWGAK